ncbi:MAG: HIT domain-containing protein, partial [Treponema sp.]|nr:HIT domain-containing protein [Treponema sp.]
QKLYEDDEVYAFRDIAPQAPVHFLVVPKKHIRNVMEAQQDDVPLLGKLLFTAQQLLASEGCAERGGRLVLNCKADGMQTVDHIHVHVLGGRPLGWPPG